jgi:glycerol kinase
MPTVIAIDQSTSSTTAILFDEQGNCLDSRSADHQQIYPEPGWVEHDPEEIWQNLVKVSSELIESNKDKISEFAAISITNQRETVVIFDRETGKPLYNAIVWQCRRSEYLCNEHIKVCHNELVQPRTGLKIDPYFSASKVQWLVRHRPEIKQALENGDALVGTIDTYLIYRMTKGKVFATDHTNASRTLLYDISTFNWDPSLCECFQVPIQALPEIKESSENYGSTNLDGILDTELPIRGVMGDSQASFFAQRCFDIGTAKVTFGTGSSVLLNIGNELKVSDLGLVTTLAWIHRGEPIYAYEGIIINSAATLNWLKNQLGLVQSIEELVDCANGVDESAGVYLVPAFSGLGLPHWESSAKAAIVGLTAHSNKQHVCRAALESIAYQLKDAIDAMQKESGIAVSSIRADGGPTKNPTLMQFTANMTELRLRVSKTSDCSALGAAMMGMLGLGLYSSINALKQLSVDEEQYFVNMNDSSRDNLYNGWRNALDQVLAGVNKIY